jgi:hypothetical protein
MENKNRTSKPSLLEMECPGFITINTTPKHAFVPNPQVSTAVVIQPIRISSPI